MNPKQNTADAPGGWLPAVRRIYQRHACEMIDPDTGEPTGEDPAAVVEANERAERAGEPEPDCRGVLVDAFTASMLCKVYDALNEENRARFAALPLVKAVSVGWKVAR